MAVHVSRSGWWVALACAVLLLAAWPLPSAVAEEATPVPPYRVDHTPLAEGVAAGGDHTCFLLRSRAVQCQGAREFGQSYGDDAGDVVQVSAGWGHTCLLRLSGNVDCYGANAYGEAVTYAGGDAVQVSAGEDHTCIRLKNGNVLCWGRNEWGQADPFTGGDVVDVSAGGSHTCVVRKSGWVDCHGANGFGQSSGYLGDDAVSVAAGQDHTCVLLTSGNVYCFGSNERDQSMGYSGGDAVAVTAGQAHTCLLLKSASVTCFGDNLRGQSEPYDGKDAIAVSAGRDHTCILLQDGMARCQGRWNEGQTTGYPFPDEPVRGAGWARNILLSEAVSFRGLHEETPGYENVALRVEGDPSGSYYRVRVSGDGISYSVKPYTLGLLQRPIDAAVVSIPSQALSHEGVTVTVVTYVEWHHESSVCGVYLQRGCMAWLPFWPTDLPFVRNEADDTRLTIGVRVHRDDGLVMHTDTVSVPYAGQVVGTGFPFVIDR